MFKNLDGFKKIKEDRETAVMQHPKGHTITIAKNSLPALHRKQITALPLHQMAEGGKIKKYAFAGVVDGSDSGSDSSDNDNQPQPTETPSPSPTPPPPQQDAASQDANAPVPTGEPSPQTGGSTGSWDTSPGASGSFGSDQPGQAAGQQPDASQGQAPGAQQPGGLGDVYDLEMNSVQNQAKSERGQIAQEQVANQEYQNSLSKAATNWDQESLGMTNQIKAALKDVNDGHINPNQYMENRSTPQKVATAIGLFLGGLSSGYTHQGNPAMDILNKQIDRDIDAQKAGLNNKMNIYHAYLEQYHNAAAAENMTRATMLGIYGSKMKQAALDNANPAILARQQAGEAQIKQQAAQYMLKAQLANGYAKFDTPGSSGSEAEYQVLSNAAQRLDPNKYKDMQEKYVPGVGTSAIPIPKDEVSSLSTLKNLSDLAKQAQDFSQQNGRTFWGTDANQKANDISKEGQLRMGELVNLKRLTPVEFDQYKDLFKSPGSWNQGNAVQSFQDLQKNIQGKARGIFQQYNIKPFRK